MIARWRVPRAPLACLAVAGLILFQGWAYFDRLTLSLGPRVILQPWLLANGYLPYEHIVDQHTPLLPLLLAPLRLVCPDGLLLARLVLAVLLSATTLLTFLAARRTGGWLAGLLAAVFVVTWSPLFRFGKLWHESFLAPLYLILLLAYDPRAARRPPLTWVGLGVLGGCAFLVKQYAAVVFGAFMLWTLFTTWHARRSRAEVARQGGLMVLGAVLPLLAMAAYQAARAGSLHSALYWTLTFNLTSGYHELAARGPSLADLQALAASCLLLPAAVVHVVQLRRRGDAAWPGLGWGLLLLATASLTAYPRFEFFHLQPALPVLAWLSAQPLAAGWRSEQPARALLAGVTLGLLIFWLLTLGAAYRPAWGAGAERKIWEYSDLVPLAAEIRQHVPAGQAVYVFPDDEATANLYYLLDTRPPRFWLFTYPWYVQDWVDRRIVATLEAAPPDWIVSFPGRWDTAGYAPGVTGYIDAHYQPDAELRWAHGEVWLFKRRP